MLQTPVIKLRDLKELQCSQKLKAENDEFITPFKVKKPRKARTTATKTKKPSEIAEGAEEEEQQQQQPVANTVAAVPATPKTAGKRIGRSARKEPPPSQLRINSFFKTCEKSYKIESFKGEPPTPVTKKTIAESAKAKGGGAATTAKHKSTTTKNTATSTKTKSPKRSRKMGRKRLFIDETSESDYELTSNSKHSDGAEWRPSSSARHPTKTTSEYITIISDSDEEECANKELVKTEDLVKTKTLQPNKKSPSKEEGPTKAKTRHNSSAAESLKEIDIAVEDLVKTKTLQPNKKSPSREEGPTNAKTRHDSSAAESLKEIDIAVEDLVKTITVQSNKKSSSRENGSTKAKARHNSSAAESLKDTDAAPPQAVLSVTNSNSKTPATTRRKPKPCPPYKIVEGTTFAVDAFQYGCIADVTHYFLTHFHADHYIGLTRKFAMPLYMSSVTARLVRTFIPIDEQYIHELELNTPTIVDNVEITALDANHCPGAIMLLFKFPKTGKCILHTGDFRAWHGMESEPDFWNNDIHTIYLDTTYMSNNYSFCTQYESIDKAKILIDTFREKHCDSRILYVCGSYVIGKEKFWSAIAQEYKLKVWTEENRSKALKAIDDKDLNRHLVDNPGEANMHVLSMVKFSYLSLVDYFAVYEHEYDKLLAIRPSGWEKDSKPQYRGKINIIGIEYSEHSSYEEMQRFVKFLKPAKVISTVPTGRDLMKTAIVPEKWYKYKNLHGYSNYQPCIEQFMGKTPQKKSAIRLPNARKGGLETFVSPLKKKKCSNTEEINNNYEQESIVSTKSSEKYLEKSLPGHTNPFAIHENNSNDYEENKTALSKSKKKAVVVDIKQDFVNGKQNLNKTNNSLRKTKQRNAAQITPKTADNKTEVIIKQSLQEGESCSIFIPNSLEHQPVSMANSSDYFDLPSYNKIATDAIQPVSRNNSSEFFEPTTSKITCRKLRVKESSTSGEEIPVSQKRNTRSTTKQTKASSVASTMDEDELEFEIQLLKETQNQSALTETINGKQNHNITSLKVSQNINPLLKSTTTSYASSTYEEHAAVSETGMVLESALRVLSNNSCSQNEQIPSSQTTNDLANTPRPLRNRIKYTCSQIPFSQNEQISASQTTNDLANTPRPLRNKMKLAYLWQTSRQDDEKPALKNNKRINPNNYSSSIGTSPLKRSKESLLPDNKVKHGGFTAPISYSQNPRVLTQILEVNEAIDMYNISQTAQIVAKALAHQEPDKSNDHIPLELLSPSDDDENDTKTFPMKPVKSLDHMPSQLSLASGQDSEQNIKKTSPMKPVSHQNRFKSVVKIPSELSLSSGQDSVDDENVFKIDVYNKSKMLDLVVVAASQQQPDNSVDHIPPELLSPTDVDAEDDWLY